MSLCIIMKSSNINLYDKRLLEIIKQLFNIEEGIIISKVVNGYNIRYKPQMIKAVNYVNLFWNEEERFCRKCGYTYDLHFHHIVSKAAGGKDEKENGLILCFDCHVGNNGLHKGKWRIGEIVPHYKIKRLQCKYGVVSVDT